MRIHAERRGKGSVREIFKEGQRTKVFSSLELASFGEHKNAFLEGPDTILKASGGKEDFTVEGKGGTLQ